MLARQNFQFYVLGKPCGDIFCDENMECCMGCDGPMGICMLPRDQGGIGCPIHKCMPQGKVTFYYFICLLFIVSD